MPGGELEREGKWLLGLAISQMVTCVLFALWRLQISQKVTQRSDGGMMDSMNESVFSSGSQSFAATKNRPFTTPQPKQHQDNIESKRSVGTLPSTGRSQGARDVS